MSTRTWKLGVAGLGALSLSCAGLQLGHVSTGNSSVDTALALAGTANETANETAKKSSDCEKLKAKVSIAEERALGGAVALNWVTGGKGLMLGNTSEERLQEYLNIVGRNLAAQSSRPTLLWTFGVLKATDAYNAASAPGGYVFVTRGLLKDVENEAQLAGVLAHEIAHVTLQHALNRYDEVKVEQCEKLTLKEGGTKSAELLSVNLHGSWRDAFQEALAGSGALDLDKNVDLLGHLTNQVVEKVVTNGYAEEDEFAADEQAVRLLVSAGYDPKEYIHFLGKLSAKSSSKVAHHPKPLERQERLNKLLSNAASEADEFPELPAADSLSKPALAPEFAIARSTDP